MSERHCQHVDVDGTPVIACGGQITEGDLKVIREFQAFLRTHGRWHEMANPRTSSSHDDLSPRGEATSPGPLHGDARGPGGAPNVPS